MNTKHSDVAIIGGGLGGLAAACCLAAKGLRTSLYEANDWVGGKAAVLNQNGFRFDMGPTIVTLPSVLKRIFKDSGRPLEEYLHMVRLDPQWRSFFSDGSTLDLWQEVKRMQAELEIFAQGHGLGLKYERLIKMSAKLDDISQRYFFWKAIGGMRDMFDVRNTFNPSTLGDVFSMRLGSTVGGTMRSHMPNPKVAQMLDHFTQYVGSAPDASPAVLCGIAHMQTSEGVWYPMGGTRAVPEALERLALELGVHIHTRTKVVEITQRGKEVTGLLLDSGEVVRASIVVANSDVVRTHREMLTPDVRAGFNSRRKYEAACSGVVLYLGLNRRYEHLAHHDFVFSRDPHEEFEYIYRKGEPAPDPTCYVCAPSQTESQVAPAGGEALYVLVHTPYLRPGQDWKEMFPRYRQTIINKLKTTGQMPDLEERIVCESALTPQDINDRYHVLDGAIYGLASHGRFLGAFKPSNRSPDLRGLYFAGGSAHPGPGMPMALMSGWIAADAILQDKGALTRAQTPAQVPS